MNYRKYNAYFILLISMGIILFSAFQNPMIPECGECTHCDIYKKQVELQSGKCSLAEFNAFKEARLKYIEEYCKDGYPPPPPPPPPDTSSPICRICAISYKQEGDLLYFFAQKQRFNGKECEVVPNTKQPISTLNHPNFSKSNSDYVYMVATYLQNMPTLFVENDLIYNDWHNGKNNCGVSKHRFSALTINQKTQQVVIMHSNEPNTFVEVPNFPRAWCNPQFRTQFKNKYDQWFVNIAIRLTLVAAFDSNFEVQVPQDIEKQPRILVKALYNGRQYSIGIDSTGFYFPISNQTGMRQAIYQSLSNPQNAKTYESLLQKWYQTGERRFINDFLPIAWQQSTLPLGVLGGNKTFAHFNEARLQKAIEGEPLIFQITPKITKAGTELQIQSLPSNLKKDSLLYYLSWAAQKMTILASRETPTYQMVFFFGMHKTTLWSWSSSNGVLTEQILLENSQHFAWTEQPIQPYLERLSTQSTPAESQFWLEQTGAIMPLDWNLEYNILLIGKLESDIWQVSRLSFEGKSLEPLQFRFIGGNVQKCYQDWRRTHLWNHVLNQKTGASVYVSPYRYGFKNEDNITIQSRADCGLNQKSWNAFLLKVDEIVYLPTIKPTELEAFQHWLLPNWDRKVWRANPLGLIASIP